MKRHHLALGLLVSMLLGTACSREDSHSAVSGARAGTPDVGSLPTRSATDAKVHAPAPPTPRLITLPANRNATFQHLAGRAFVTQTHGYVIEGPAADVIARLKAQALAGDGAASYAIFLKLYQCEGVYKRLAQGRGPSGPSAAAAQCEALPPAEAVRSPEWLALAAEQGNIGAQMLYSTDSTSALGGPAALLRDPMAVLEYKQRAVGYLDTLASQGSIDALGALANAYDVGVLVPENLVTSRAYYEAMRLADPSVNTANQVNELEKQMTATQLAAAVRKGEEIYAACCR